MITNRFLCLCCILSLFSVQGCLPLQEYLSQPPKAVSEPVADVPVIDTPVAEEADELTDILAYYQHLATLSGEGFTQEYSRVLAAVRDDDESKLQFILICLSPRLSDERVAEAGETMARMTVDETFSKAANQKLLTLLLELSRERLVVRQNNRILGLEKTRTETEMSQIRVNLQLCADRTKALEEQLHGLKEIEKIIIQRKETDPLP